MHFKTIEDYLNAATSHGFEIVDFTEARVRAADMVSNMPFFSSVNGFPLHMVVKLRKPMSTNDAASLGSMNTLDLLPKKLNWPRTVTNNVENSLVMLMPTDVNTELVAASLQVYEKGISVDDLDIGNDIDLPRTSVKSGKVRDLFSATKEFGKGVRSRLLHETGAVIVKGLDMTALGGVERLDKMTACSKIAYFILSEHIGTVDATARGKLFDVKRCALLENELQLSTLARLHLVLYLTNTLFPPSSTPSVCPVPILMQCLNPMTMSSSRCPTRKRDGTLMVPQRIGCMMLYLSCASLPLQRVESSEFLTHVSQHCALAAVVAVGKN